MNQTNKKPNCWGLSKSSLVCLLLLCLVFTKTLAKTSSYNVLFLNSYNIGYAWSDSITKGIKKALNRNDIKLYIESLDSKRFGQDNFPVFCDYITKKYNLLTFDAIITSDNDALDFAIHYGQKLFPDVPVVFCGISNPEHYKLEGTHIYGFTESTDPNKTVSVLTQLMPEAKSLLFVTDNTTSGSVIKKEYQKLQKSFPFIKITFVSDIDVEELIKTVKKGDNDIVYLLRINRDKYGNLLEYLDFFKKIAEASPKPVFADDEAIIGFGVVGGNANRGFTQGYRSAMMALEIIQNPESKNFQHFNKVQDEYIFDYRQLKRFNIRSDKLPKKSVIINQPMVEYLKYIIILAIAVVVLTSVVIILTVINRKRLLAERKVSEQLTIINERNALLEHSYTQLSELNCELEEANAQLSNMNISLEEAKEKAEESEKLKASFLANLSHEIRTPLNAILGFSSLLIEPTVKEKVKQSYYNIIQSNSDSLLVLIDDILDFSKIEAGQVKVFKEPVAVNKIFEELYNQFKQKSNEKVNLIISEFALANPVVIFTDKIRFKQILSNLLTNAFKFTEKGFIEIGFVIPNQSDIKFYVKDTGIGIDKKFHQTVFERFRKLEEENTKLYSGSGLGLAICKKLVELLDGKIWVEGEPGKGSIFYFTQPCLERKNGSDVLQPLKKLNTDYNWQGNTIAVAEDEENNYLLLEEIIRNHGAEVIRFRDGISIVKYFAHLKENPVNLVLMDIKMPGMDGYQAMTQIKNLYPDLTIIAQTAYAMSDDIARIKEKGFADFVTKPINMEIFKEKLNKYLAPA